MFLIRKFTTEDARLGEIRLLLKGACAVGYTREILKN